MAFFERVSKEPELRTVLDKLGIAPQNVGLSQHNAVFTVTKPDWTLALPGQPKELSIHFEARNRREIRLEVGLRPYEGHIEKKPIFSKLRPTLDIKTLLIIELRARCLALASALPATVTVSTLGLRNAALTESHTAVKLEGNLGVDPPPAETAHFFGLVIQELAPVVDQVAAEKRPRLPD
jgi:hypothetical protein